MNPKFAEDLKKILGLPEKNKQPEKQPDQPRILANTGRFVYSHSSAAPAAAAPADNPPPNWVMPPLCDLYAPNDPNKQCICLYFQEKDLPECDAELIKLATESASSYYSRQIGFYIYKAWGNRHESYESKKGTWSQRVLSSTTFDKPYFYVQMPEHLRQQAITELNTLSAEQWRVKWGSGGWAYESKAHVVGLSQLRAEFEKVAPFLNSSVAEKTRNALNADNFSFWQDKNGATRMRFTKPEVFVNQYISARNKFSASVGNNAAGEFSGNVETANYAPNQAAGVGNVGYFQFAAAPTNIDVQNTQKWLDKLSRCVSLIATPIGFQAACPTDPRIPPLIKGKWFSSVALLTSDDEPIRLSRFSRGWAVSYRGFTTVFDVVDGEVTVVDILSVT